MSDEITKDGYVCKICYGTKSVSESSHYSSSSESDDEYFDDIRDVRTSDVTSETGSASETNDGGEIKTRYTGFRQYPSEIQEFIKAKHGSKKPTDAKSNDGEESAVKNNEDALNAVLGDEKVTDEAPVSDVTEGVKNLNIEGEENASQNEEGSENNPEDNEDSETGSRSKRDLSKKPRHHYSKKPRRHDSGDRDHHGHHGHHSDHHRRDRHRRHRHSEWKMSKIICPTGKTFHITQPANDKSGWHCGSKSTLITLHKDGRMGRREYNIVTKEMEKTRVTHTSGTYSGYEFIKVEKIVNPCLWKRYRYSRARIMSENNGKANDHLLWHGSKHVAELVNTGFDERHANTRGMFGAGLYFAPNSSKSNQYIWSGGCAQHKSYNCFICERQLLLCRVSLGKVMQYTTAQQHLAHPPVGYHSVEGVAGPALQYNENIVYRGEQVYPEYLVTYKIVP